MKEDLLQQYFKMHEELDRLNELVSETLRTVQDQFGGVKHKFNRKNKEGIMAEVALTENTLWEEVFHFGTKGNEAADFLRAKYPDVFAHSDKSAQVASDIKLFEISKLGFEFTKMNGSSLIKLVNKLIEMKEKKSLFTRFINLFK